MKRSHETDVYLISPRLHASSRSYIGSFPDSLSPIAEYEHSERSPETSPLNNRKFTFDPNHNRMPLQTSPRSFVDQVPQLTAVYNGQPSPGLITNIPQSDLNQQKQPFDHSESYPVQSHPPFSQFRQHRNSISTSTSDSADSSPTTTASLTDACSTTETPGTSPDTPASTQSISYPSLAMRAYSNCKPELRLATSDQISKVNPPMKKARNLKNLAVDTTTAAPLGRAISTASLPLQPSQTLTMGPPPTPCTLRPLGPQRPKSNNHFSLKISTQSADASGIQPVEGAVVPPTPSLMRPAALRHFQSSPSLPLISTGLPPEGGMKLPPLATRKALIPVGFSQAPMEAEEEEIQDFTIPQSREEKPETYPDGPICIYDPHIYLYFEPTTKIASDYDVIFNVASEVKNPFDSAASKAEPLQDSTTPDTPKANGITIVEPRSDKNPEYIHVPWEHNTDIVPDLYHLVNLIDERVQQGKRVLIHCQCGVSRSASLIVAYGLFKNPSITVQDAYDAVKRRSKWIGPNMSLIMQLQEFRSGLVNHVAGIPSLSISRNPRTKIIYSDPTMAKLPNGSSPHEHSESLSAIPMTAPLQQDIARLRSQSLSVESPQSRGPSSAPSGFPWPSDHKVVSDSRGGASPDSSTIQPASAYVDASGQLLPGPQIGLQPKAVEETIKDNLSIQTSVLSAPGLGRNGSEEKVIAPSEQSARAFDFGGFGIGSPRSELFSPKTDTFGDRLPQHFRFESVSSRLSVVMPPEEESSEVTVEARRQLKSQLGMNTRSHWDLRSSARAQVSQSRAPRSRSIGPPSNHSGLEVSDALMSPRATEFTINPFHDSLSPPVDVTERDSKDTTPQPLKLDPRSPPQKGVSPIVRNISDVFQ